MEGSDWAAGEHGSDRAQAAVRHAGHADPGAGQSNPSGIHIEQSKQGSLHDALGVPQDQKIPVSKLQSQPGDSAALAKKKNFARNARGWGH